MKVPSIAASAAFLAFTCTTYAQSSHSCGEAIDASLRSGAVLVIDSISSGIELTATDQEKIHVTCETGEHDNADVHLSLSGFPTHSELRIKGTRTGHDHLQIHIEVPRKTNLQIEMAAGQVTVKEIVGDKKIELKAGQISITSPHMSDYKKVDVSVGIGQVDAPVYSENRGGFFRSLQKENHEGEYLLQAHVATGQIQLLGKPDHATAN